MLRRFCHSILSSDFCLLLPPVSVLFNFSHFKCATESAQLLSEGLPPLTAAGVQSNVKPRFTASFRFFVSISTRYSGRAGVLLTSLAAFPTFSKKKLLRHLLKMWSVVWKILVSKLTPATIESSKSKTLSAHRLKTHRQPPARRSPLRRPQHALQRLNAFFLLFFDSATFSTRLAPAALSGSSK